MSEDRIERFLHSDLEIEKYKLLNFINLSGKDIEMIRMWRNHPDVRIWMYSQHEIEEKEHISFIESLKKSYGNAYWLVKSESDYLGVLYLNRINLRHKHAYMGLYANPFQKTSGAGKILGRLVIRLAFDILDLHTLKLEVMEDNERAIKLYTKLGFKEEGRLKEFINRNGRWIDVIVMGIINPKHE